MKNNKFKSLDVQLIETIEQRISLNINNFLVLSEEGNPGQIAFAFQTAKNEFLKFAPEMIRLASKVGGDLPTFVNDFIESIDIILHGTGMLNEDLISRCYDTTARLKAEIKRSIRI